MNYRNLRHTCQGYSHIKSNTPCQDAALCYSEEHFVVAAVSDGHGDVRHMRSQYGAQWACEIAVDKLATAARRGRLWIEELKNSENTTFSNLKEEIIITWVERTRQHAAEYPFTQEEFDRLHAENLERYVEDYSAHERVERAYGCTLLAAVIMEKFWFCMRIGDGGIAMTCGDGIFSFPLSNPDDPNSGNVTHSLCETHAESYFSCVWGETPPSALLMYTDGIEKAYKPQSMLLMKLLSWLVNCYVLDPENAQQRIEHFLSGFSKDSGPQDDIGVAAIFLNQALSTPRLNRDQLKADVALIEKERSECVYIIEYNEAFRQRLQKKAERNPQDGAYSAQLAQVEEILCRKRGELAQIEDRIAQHPFTLMNSDEQKHEEETNVPCEETNKPHNDSPENVMSSMPAESQVNEKNDSYDDLQESGTENTLDESKAGEADNAPDELHENGEHDGRDYPSENELSVGLEGGRDDEHHEDTNKPHDEAQASSGSAENRIMQQEEGGLSLPDAMEDIADRWHSLWGKLLQLRDRWKLL